MIYYNEIDPFCAAWLQELMNDNLIPFGIIDTRSIEDVTPDDLKDFAQCHFFAGIGVWPLALRLAGWPADRPIWTGSCPCQPFSAAGKGAGFADERHLWPAFYHLIRECRPRRIIGEQVAGKNGDTWLDLVQTDVEAAGYAFGANETCACGFGAPHKRSRNYWVADAARFDLGGRRIQRSSEGAGESVGATRERSEGLRPTGSVADTFESRRPGESGSGAAQVIGTSECGGIGHNERSGPVNGYWRDADWLFCRDKRWRPVEPATFPLADAGAFRNRVAELRGAGNALNLAQAVEFIQVLNG